MQRLIVAIIALTTLLAPAALRAQQDGKPVDPSNGPQAIDEPAPPQQSSTSMPASHEEGEILVGAHKTVDSVSVNGQKLEIAGHVKHDVVATDSDVTIDSGASVGGTIYATNSRVTNHAGSSVRIEQHGAAGATIGVVAGTQAQPVDLQRRRRKRDWTGSQFALLLFGLLGGALSVIITPNASKRVAEHVAANPRRDLRAGVIVGLGLLAILIADAILLHLPLIRLLWAPFGIMIAFAPLLLLGFGWVAAIRCAGDCVAARMNRKNAAGTQFGRAAIGLFAFFLVNVVLGHLSPTLGVLGLCAEISIALMGVGATVLIATGNGFGRRA